MPTIEQFGESLRVAGYPDGSDWWIPLPDSPRYEHDTRRARFQRAPDEAPRGELSTTRIVRLRTTRVCARRARARRDRHSRSNARSHGQCTVIHTMRLIPVSLEQLDVGREG
jgi:hypothetical protein